MYSEEVDNSGIQLVRTVKTGFPAEIVALKASIWLGIVVTGHVDGTLAIWDFEKSMIKSFLKKHADAITDIVMVEPYPVAVTCANDGLICIWHLRKFQLLACFINESLNPSSSKFELSGLSSLLVMQLSSPIERTARQPKMLKLNTYREFKSNYVLAQYED